MRQFYGHLEKMLSFCRKNHVRKIPLFWGGGFWGGGGSADFIFMGARIFLIVTRPKYPPYRETGVALEAQQRYFSYRAILAAIVSQNLFVLVFMGYRTIIARYVAKWGIAQMRLCKN